MVDIVLGRQDWLSDLLGVHQLEKLLLVTALYVENLVPAPWF